MGSVLGFPQHLSSRSFSLSMVQKTQNVLNSMGAQEAKENSSNNENDQSATMKMIKMKNEWKIPPIYNKISSYPR